MRVWKGGGSLKSVRNFLFITLFCALFGAIYEHFSFGVYSNFMIYAFGWPFVFGALPALYLMGKSDDRRKERQKGPSMLWAKRLWHTGIAILTVGSIVRGILDIYGTTSGMTNVYWIVGGAMLGIGLAWIAFSLRTNRRTVC